MQQTGQPLLAGALGLAASVQKRSQRMTRGDLRNHIGLGGHWQSRFPFPSAPRDAPHSTSWPCRRDRAHCSSRHNVQIRVMNVCRLNQCGMVSLPGVAIHQPILIGQNEQRVGIDQVCDQCRQGVVISQANLICHHRIVFINDRQHPIAMRVLNVLRALR